MTVIRYSITALVVVAVIALGGAVFVWSGVYDVGADDRHTRPVAALLQGLRARSVAARAADIETPNLDDPKMIAAGAREYSEMCVSCHLAPGIADSEIRLGLYPMPPNLAEHAVRDPKQAFWIIKHGIKMSAMPAWGTSHDDTTIWSIVAFTSRMPEMTEAEYRQMIPEATGEKGHTHLHGHN